MKLLAVRLVVLGLGLESTTVLSAAGQAAPTEVVIEAAGYTQASDSVTTEVVPRERKVVRPPTGKGWLAYKVRIPVAGRYRCDVRLAARTQKPAVLWVEDYIDNKDGRTYNVTADMVVPPAAGFRTVSRFGSPLNTGLHKMKLHYQGEGLQICSVKFTLLKRHQLTPTTMTQRIQGTEWGLVWSDEFDGSGPPDPAKWTCDIGNWGWGNQELQYYTAYRAENARQEQGNLIVEARKNDRGHAWTSARLTTRGTVSFLYGKIEIRAKAPVGDGAWAAGWLLGDAYRDEISWPYCGEVDILECVGREIDDQSGDGVNHASCHTRAYYFKQGNHISSKIAIKNLNAEFHTYTMEWTPQAIRIFLDGKHYYTYDKTKGDLEWPFNQPQNLILNLAMGGGMGGPIDPTLTSQRFVIDYVRVFGRK